MTASSRTTSLVELPSRFRAARDYAESLFTLFGESHKLLIEDKLDVSLVAPPNKVIDGEFNRSLQHILRTSQPASDRAWSFSAIH